MADFIPSAEDFLSYLNKPGEVVSITGYNFKGHIHVNPENFKCAGIEFRECNIGGLFFEDIKVGVYLTFTNCTFPRLSFKNVYVDKGNTELTYGANVISINRCVVSEFLLIRNCLVNGNVGIYNSELNEFGVAHLSAAELSLQAVMIKSFIELLGNKLKNSITFLGCTVEDTLLCQRNNTGIHFHGSVFKETCTVEENDNIGALHIINCEFESQFIIERSRFIDELRISKSHFKKFCEIFFVEQAEGVGDISILSSSFDEGIKINGRDNHEKIEYAIKRLKIRFSNQLSGVVEICNCSVLNFHITGTNSNASLIVKNVSMANLCLVDFSNQSNVQFMHCQSIGNASDSRVSILNSYLGKAQFFNFDFDTFLSVNINNSFLSEIITSNVDWFDFRKLNKEGNFKRNFGFRKGTIGEKAALFYQYGVGKEVYRQLKVATEKHGNRTDALIFQQLEMKYYEGQLKYSKKKLTLDRIILWTNNSNSHGQNWLKPIGLAVITTAVFYFLIVSSALPDGANLGCTLRSEGRLFFQMFNPVRSLDKTISTENVTPLTEFLDLIHRILISYFIFQTVSAFRKYTKS